MHSSFVVRITLYLEWGVQSSAESRRAVHSKTPMPFIVGSSSQGAAVERGDITLRLRVPVCDARRRRPLRTGPDLYSLGASTNAAIGLSGHGRPRLGQDRTSAMQGTHGMRERPPRVHKVSRHRGPGSRGPFHPGGPEKRLEYGVPRPLTDWGREEFHSGEQNARIVARQSTRESGPRASATDRSTSPADAEQHYRTLTEHGVRSTACYGRDESWNLRDTHMFQTLVLVRTLKHRVSVSKAIVWTHSNNSHVGDARAASMGWPRAELKIHTGNRAAVQADIRRPGPQYLLQLSHGHGGSRAAPGRRHASHACGPRFAR